MRPDSSPDYRRRIQLVMPEAKNSLRTARGVGRGVARGIARGASGLLIVVGVLGPAGTSLAATFSGALASPAAAAALLAVDCTDSGSGAPASLTLQVTNSAPVSGAFVSAQIRKGNLATNTTDPVDGDAGASPAVFVNGGAGRYDVFVDKTGSGAEAFSVTAQCWTGAGGSGVAAGTAIRSAQGGSVPMSSLGGGLLALGLSLVCASRAAARRFARTH